MANDVKWIKITTDIFDDEKMLMIEAMPSADSIIVIWFKLLTLAGKQNNDGVFMMSNRVAYTDEMLASIFRREINTVRLALKVFQQFGMIEIVEDVIAIPNWNKHQTLDAYERKKVRDRIYQQQRRDRQKAVISGLLTEKSSDTSSDASSDSRSPSLFQNKNKNKNKNKNNINTMCDSDESHEVKKPSKAEIDDFFEKIWSQYPEKKGKGQVSDSKKKTLYEIGEAEMQRAIDRYLAELKKDADWRKPQNGSTFFNSGYVDYLDANFVPQASQEKPAPRTNATAERLNESYNMMKEWSDSDD